MQPNDQTFIQAALQGDLDAFNTLVKRYQDAVYTTAYRIMGSHPPADDATQETFINAYRKLNTYRGGNFRAWLLRIATRTCYDLLRYEKRRPATSFEDMPGAEHDDGAPIPSPTETPEQAVQRGELARIIQSCIDALKPEQRIALVMCDVQGFSYQEVAETAHVALGTVKSRLSRARLSVRDCLQPFAELLPPEYRLNSKTNE
jgi:RNA polymerase sigma-70 factor (ECF subfamily)